MLERIVPPASVFYFPLNWRQHRICFNGFTVKSSAVIYFSAFPEKKAACFISFDLHCRKHMLYYPIPKCSENSIPADWIVIVFLKTIITRLSNEKRCSSELRTGHSDLRLRESVEYHVHPQRIQSRYLRGLPPVLHGQTETGRHGWPG